MNGRDPHPHPHPQGGSTGTPPAALSGAVKNPRGHTVVAGGGLCFLTAAAKIRGVVMAAACLVTLLGVACDSGTLTGSDQADGGGMSACANVGCSAPPLCSVGCQAACGCCPCAAGERAGDLLCVGGCYQPAPEPAPDAGASPDGAGDAAADVPVGGWMAAPECLLPFEVGPCDAAFSVYAFVGGACVPQTYGGCSGNANRFSTLEECMATCEGRPGAGACPTGREAREICLACGLAGGCMKSITACALTCQMQGAPCASGGHVCYDGVCQAAFCI